MRNNFQKDWVILVISFSVVAQLTLGDVLKHHHSEVVNKDITKRLTIRRAHIFDDAVMALSTIDEKQQVRIRFLGESAVDDGGPRREFFMLLMGAIANNGSILDGPPNRRLLRHNADAFEVKDLL